MVVKSPVVLYACGIVFACVFASHGLDLLKSAAASGNIPSRPTVKCRCAVYPNQTLCSWTESPQLVPTRYIASYSERHKRSVIKQCQIFPTGSLSPALISRSSSLFSSSPSSEKLWLCPLDNLKLYTDYIFNITAINLLGSSTHLTSFMLEDIVKPDPPVDVRVSPNGFRKLSVAWSPPPTWSNLEIFPLKYQIRYQWNHRGNNQTIHLGPYESDRVELKGVAPDRTYLFQVCAMELLGLGQCSDWSSPVQVFLTKR